jgi:single-strand DNA-binding protein
MQIIHLTGNLGRDPELRSTNNDQVCSFSVAVKQGFDRDAKSEWFRCSVWGKRAETVSRYLRKGQKVTVAGHLTIGEYQGKPQYDVRVIDVEWPHEGQAERRDDARQTGGGSQSGGNAHPHDLDDNVPW